MLHHDVAQSDLVNVDGMGVVWGARLLGIPVPERVTGIDLMSELLAVCSIEGFRPYLLGATEDVLDSLAKDLRKRYPTLELAGQHHGYFCPAEEPAIISKIATARPDCLFVALPTPQKERLVAALSVATDIPVLMGVGGSFDVLAGRTARAPLWMQRFGLEWLFRTIQEPRRMWKRYLTTNAIFAGLLVRELLSRRPTLTSAS